MSLLYLLYCPAVPWRDSVAPAGKLKRFVFFSRPYSSLSLFARYRHTSSETLTGKGKQMTTLLAFGLTDRKTAISTLRVLTDYLLVWKQTPEVPYCSVTRSSALGH